ncbi:MAG: ABC transporter ATP-binding protein [Ilumatobacteraceae bacterium]
MTAAVMSTPSGPAGVAVAADTRRGWRLLRTVLRGQRRGLALGVLTGVLWGVGKVSVPALTSRAIDRAVLGDGPLAWWVVLLVSTGVLAGVFTAARRWYAFRESRLTETVLREQLFGHVLRLHAGYHDRTQTGQLMSRASSDLQQVQGFVVMIPLTASHLVMVVAIVTILLVQQPLLALVALAPLPLLNVLATRFSRRIHPAVVGVQQAQARLATVVEESVSGVRVVKGFGAERVTARRLADEADRIRGVSLEAARVRSAFIPGLDLLPSLGLLAVLAIGGHRVLDGDMTRGQMIEFMQYIGLLISPFRSVGMTVAFAQRASAALGRVDDVLSTPLVIADPSGERAAPPTSRRGDVVFDGVTFGYDESSVVLDHLDLTVAAGTSLAIVGATGSGKSTLARLLVRLYDVRSGSIAIDGIDVRDMSLADLRRTVSIVFEDTLLFHDSVAANIAFARPDAPHADVLRAAQLAGATDFVDDLPDGYATLLGERGYSLSGGQRQRIALARAILADPRVLVLDDATSAVDPSKEHEIREAMATVMRGRTTIVIAHRPGTIALADRVVLLDGGRVAAEGTHDELLSSSARYREVLAAYADDEREQVDR